MKILNNEPSKPNSLDQIRDQAKYILTEVMQFRRMVKSEDICDSASCTRCQKQHIDKIITAIKEKKKIKFVLPAFPGKSPNPAKVLGHLPDMAEKKALTFLNNLCKQIQKKHEPGAEVIICSDGRVFSDVVGIPEKDVTAYQMEIDCIIEKLNLTALSVFNLDNIYVDGNFDQARSELIEQYGQDLDSLKTKIKKGGNGSNDPEEKEANRLYCGLTRFLVEDLLFPGQTRSKSSIQKECKIKAYQAIIRSNAWTDLIAEKFPEAIRLSIHPQICGSKKIGIQLLGIETWMTPWHAVAVNTGDKFILMKHKEAQKLNVTLVEDVNGRPSHYELIQKNKN
ncbi:L-tyrosine/L-tryptophan isonitrile synthase family protein [Aquimarina sp. I32.4]|uniref:L-tyrosine/L-tryptophan isonitrile synthase family protein n=1 Tax=Aquimarina sp. I32.4 TaxID=2053903 RepID=UPI0018EAB9BD|nr:isocyanide synthase family protein [Aquimarina sp. I32.4]